MTRTLLDFAAPLVLLLAYSASACWAPPSDAPSGSERAPAVAREDAAAPAMAPRVTQAEMDGHAPGAMARVAERMEQDAPTAPARVAERMEQDAPTAMARVTEWMEQDAPTAMARVTEWMEQDAPTAPGGARAAVDGDAPVARRGVREGDADGPDAAPLDAPGVSARLEEKGSGWLVWGRDDAGFAYTWWVEPDEPIDTESAAGAVLAIDGALWYWVVEEVPVAVELDCDLLEEVADGEGIGARAFLERVDGGARREVLAASVAEARASAQFEEHAVLTGSIGPYLFVHRSADAYRCGAHGGSEHESLVWDARAEAPVRVYAPAQLERVRMASESRAWAALAAATDGASSHFGDEVRLTLLRPTFAPSGAAELAHQWTAGVPYVLSDRAWDSYTASTELFGNDLPPLLAPHAEGSAEAVRRVREAAPGITIGGVSAPDPSLRERFLALPGEGC